MDNWYIRVVPPTGDEIILHPSDCLETPTGEVRLNEIGSMSLTISAMHPAADSIVAQSRLYWMVIFDHGEEMIAGGVVLQRRTTSDGRLQLRGMGLMHELTRALIMDEQIREFAYTPAYVSPAPGDNDADSGIEFVYVSGGSYVSDTRNFVNPTDQFTLTLASPKDFLYVGYWTPFDALDWQFTDVNHNAGSVLNVQYPRLKQGLHHWAHVSGGVDNTNGFQNNGSTEWTLPDDWVPLLHDSKERYWIRIYVTSVATDQIDLGDLSIHAAGTTTTDLATVMSHAPGSWALNSSYASGSAGTYFERMHAINVFQALSEIADRTAERFRLNLDATVDEIDWLGTTENDSGIVLARDGNAEAIAAERYVGALIDIDIHEDARESVTRLYVEGAGYGTSVINLSRALAGLPAGHTYDRTDSFIRLSPEPTPQIAAYQKFSDITSSSGRNDTFTSDALLKAGYAELLRRDATAYTEYRARATALGGRIPVGEKIRLLWRRYDGDGNAIDVNAHEVVQSVRYRIDRRYGLVADIVAASINRQPTDALSLIRRRLQRHASASNITQPSQFVPGSDGYVWFLRS